MTPHNLATLTAAAHLIAEGQLVDDAAKAVGTTGKSLRAWAIDDEKAGAVYARARIISAWTLEDEAIRIARACTPETYASDRVAIDTLKWAAAKRHPKVYGDKVDITSDGKAIQQAVIMMPAERIPDGEYEVLEPPTIEPPPALPAPLSQK